MRLNDLRSRDHLHLWRRLSRLSVAAIFAGVALVGLAPVAQAQSCAQGAGLPIEIGTLAASLKNDPDLIFEYVYNNIEYEPIFGANKGALGTLLDGRGSDLDQSELFVALLNAAANNAGISCYPTNYELGDITINSSTANGAGWLGVANNAYGIQGTFANGGTPNENLVVGSNNTLGSLSVQHFWVQVTLPSGTYVFDPSFKQHIVSTGIGIAALESVMNYSQSTLLADAGTSPNGYSISGVNYAKVDSDLKTYASNIASYLKAKVAAGTPMTLTDLIGGKTIIPLTGSPIRQTSLPYQTPGSTVTTFSTIPPSSPTAGINPYRTILSIQMPGASASQAIQLYTDQYYGHRITVFSVPSGSNFVPTLLIDGQIPSCVNASPACVNTGPATAPGSTPWQIIVTPAHPFGDMPSANTPSTLSVAVGGAYLISNGWGQVGRGMVEKHRQLLAQYIAAGDTPSSEAVLGESLAVNGYTWLAETALEQRISGLLGITTPTTTLYLHGIGISGQAPVQGTGAQGPYVDLPSNAVSGIPQVPPSTLNCPAIVGAPALTEAGGFSALESGVLQQTQAELSGMAAASTTQLIAQNVAAAGGVTYFADGTTTEGVANYFTNIRPTLVGTYSEGDLNAIDSAISTTGAAGGSPAGSQVLLPANGQIHVGSAPWVGAGYQISTFKSTSDSCSALVLEKISGGLSGGFSGDNIDPAQMTSSTAATNVAPPVASASAGQGGQDGTAIENTSSPPSSPTFGEPVDAITGQEVYQHTDLTTGSGSLPYALPFGRTYQSSAYLSDIGMGLGWADTYGIRAQINSDPYQGMGSESPISAVGTITALLISQDLLQTAPTIQTLTVATLVQNWWMNGLINNAVLISHPGSTEEFVQLPDGSFNSPVGSNTLLTSGSGSDGAGSFTNYTYTTGKGVKLYFDNRVPPPAGTTISAIAPVFLTSETWPTGVAINLAYDSSGNLQTVSNTVGRTLTLTVASDGKHIASVSNGVGTVNYTQTSVAGGSQLTKMTDPLGNATIFSYDTTGTYDPMAHLNGTPSHLTQIFYPTAPGSAFITNTYDLLGRVAHQTNADGNIWNYYLAGSRTEVISAAGNRHVTYQTPGGQILSDIAVPDAAYSADLFNDASTIIDPTSGFADVTVTKYTYDALTRLVTETWPEQNSQTLAYATSAGVPCLSTGSFSYPANAYNLCILTQTAKPGNAQGLTSRSRTMQYEPVFNNVTSSTDFTGNATTYSYNTSTGELTGMVQPAAAPGLAHPSFSYAYNANGLKTSETDATGRVTTYAYGTGVNAADLTKLVVDAGGSGHANITTNYANDAIGNRTGVTDGNGNTTTYAFNQAREVTTVTPPSSSVNPSTTYAYDQVGRVLSTSLVPPAASGMPTQTSSQSYTPTGKVASKTDPSGNVTQYFYDSDDNFHGLKDAKGNLTVYWYDGSDRLNVTVLPSGADIWQGYYPNGTLAFRSDGNNNSTWHSFDGYDRPFQTAYPDGTYRTQYYSEASGDYDDDISVIITRAGEDDFFSHDALHRVTNRTAGWNGSTADARIEYGYDLMGRMTSAQVTQSRTGHMPVGTWAIGYDSAGRRASDTLPNGDTTTYAYDAASNRTEVGFPGGSGASQPVLTLGFDTLERPVAGSFFDGTTTHPLWSTYYDPLGRVDAQWMSNSLVNGDGGATGYVYNSPSGSADTLVGAVSMVTGPNGSGGFNQTTYLAYSYDADRRLSSQTVTTTLSTPLLAHPAAAGTTSYGTPNAVNQIPQIGTASVSYNADGDLTGDGTRVYTYDQAGDGNILSASVGGSQVASYSYDPFGRRFSKTTSAGTIYYVHDDRGNEIAEYSGTSATGAWTLERRMFHTQAQ